MQGARANYLRKVKKMQKNLRIVHPIDVLSINIWWIPLDGLHIDPNAKIHKKEK